MVEIRVGIVDDQPVIRHGLAAIFAGTDLRVVASVGRDTDLSDPADLDLVLLDLYPDPTQPSIAAIARLRKETRVLVMCASGRPDDVTAAIRAGAGGFVTKYADPEVIRSAAHTVAAGGFALSAELAEVLHTEIDRHRPGSRTGRTTLSPREEEALTWIARGFTHAQTAARMGVRKPTVDTYVERIRAKLRVGNKADLTRAAMELLNTAELAG